MARLYISFLVCIGLILFFDSCSSGKKAYLHGNYYEAVITSTNRLRRDSNHKKSIETLREAYPMSVGYYEDRAKAALASNAEFKWSAVVDAYTTINIMHDEIRRSPGALKVIPNPVNYYAKLDEAKRNGAEEKYAAGLVALEINTRDKAKQAYYYFKDADNFVPGYKDVNDMMAAALWAATIKVMMDPIPVQSRNISVSAEFFDNKVSEFLHAGKINEFVRFYTRTEAQNIKLVPDHQIKIEFDEFIVGQMYMQERESTLVKDSVVVGTYVSTSLVGGGIKPPDGSRGKEQSDVPVTKDPVKEEKPAEKPVEKKEESQPADKKEDTKPVDKKESPKDEKKDGDSSDEFPPIEKIDEKDQVTICHIPPGNESNGHTLVISRSALNAHLAHGDVEGSCESAKDIGKSSDQKPKDPKSTDKKSGNEPKGNGLGGSAQIVLSSEQSVLLASSDASLHWLNYSNVQSSRSDTVKVYGSVKATLYHYRKTTISKGVLSLQIIDAKTGAVLSAEKMPGEFVWVSEWATFNGDERALSPQQLQWTRQKEMLPPQPQELFIEFTRPIFDQLTGKIADFYKRY